MGTWSEDRRFTLHLPDVEIELEGPRDLVERLYAQIVEDLAPLVEPDAPRESDAHPVWVYGLTALYDKVYVVDASELDATVLRDVVDVRALKRIHVEGVDGFFDRLGARSRTLHAEFHLGQRTQRSGG